MKFATDDYFHIGQMHLVQGKPCQDYAFSSIYNDLGFGVVSDGCSSGRHTDIGSRVISLATASSVKDLSLSGYEASLNPSQYRKSIVIQQERIIKFTRDALNLELHDMLATCNYICLSPRGGFVHLRGDGAIAVLYNNGIIRLISCQWDKNTPLYPAYVDDDYKRFIDHHGGDPSGKVVKAESWRFDGKTFTQESEEMISISEGIEGSLIEFSEEELSTISCVAVFTDGVMQVGDIVPDGNLMDWKDVVAQLMAFKSLTGDFAKRRIIRFLKDCRKGNKAPLDDIAYAVVRVVSNEEDS